MQGHILVVCASNSTTLVDITIQVKQSPKSVTSSESFEVKILLGNQIEAARLNGLALAADLVFTILFSIFVQDILYSHVYGYGKGNNLYLVS